DSFGKITFNKEELDLDHLGHIVENHIFRFALIKELQQQPRATLMFDTEYKQIPQSESEGVKTLKSREPNIAKLRVAADGA
ncbi:monooxygenase, partial [Pseudoalteromonas sp. S2893]